MTIAVVSTSNAGAQNATSVSVPAPASIVSGNLLYAVFTCDDTSSTLSLASSGWTKHISESFTTHNDNGFIGGFWKIAGGSEPASYTFSGSTIKALNIGIMQISGVNASNPFNSTAPIATKGTASVSPVYGSITLPSASYLLLLAGQAGQTSSTSVSTSYTPPSGYSAGVSSTSQAAKGNTYDGESCFAVLSSAAIAAGAVTPASGTLNVSFAYGAVVVPLLAASGASSTAVITSSLGALSASVAGTPASTAVGASSLGALGATGSATKASVATAASTLGSLAAQGAAALTATAVVVSSLGALSSSGTAAQQATAVSAAPLGALSASGAATQSQTAAAEPMLGPLFSAGSAVQQISGAAASVLGALTTEIIASTIPQNIAIGSSTLGALATSGVATQSSAATVTGALGDISSSIEGRSGQAATTSAALGSLQARATAQAAAAAVVTSSLGPLSTSVIATPQPASYLPDPRYYARSPARCFYVSGLTREFYAELAPRNFYAQAPARGFYVALPARSFYAQCQSAMTVIFEPKDPRESVVLTFDASLDLADGETLTGEPTVLIFAAVGIDTGPALVLTGIAVNAAALSVNGRDIGIGAGAQAVATGGLDGCRYLVSITFATTNPNKTLTLKALLPVTVY